METNKLNFVITYYLFNDACNGDEAIKVEVSGMPALGSVLSGILKAGDVHCGNVRLNGEHWLEFDNLAFATMFSDKCNS